MWVSGPPTRNQLWGVLSPLRCFLGHFRLISTARRVFGGPPDLACGVRTPRELLRTVGPTRPRNPLGNLGPFSKALSGIRAPLKRPESILGPTQGFLGDC